MKTLCALFLRFHYLCVIIILFSQCTSSTDGTQSGSLAGVWVGGNHVLHEISIGADTTIAESIYGQKANLKIFRNAEGRRKISIKNNEGGEISFNAIEITDTVMVLAYYDDEHDMFPLRKVTENFVLQDSYTRFVSTCLSSSVLMHPKPEMVKSAIQEYFSDVASMSEVHVSAKERLGNLGVSILNATGIVESSNNPKKTYALSFDLSKPESVQSMKIAEWDDNWCGSQTVLQAADNKANINVSIDCEGGGEKTDFTVDSSGKISKVEQVILDALDEAQARELLKKGFHPNSALIYACQNHNADFVDELIRAGADINVALFWAVEFEDINITKKLIDQGAKLNEKSTIEEMRNLVYQSGYNYLRERWTNPGGCSNVAFSKNEDLKKLVLSSVEGKMYSNVWDYAAQPGVRNSDLIIAAGLGNTKAVEFMLEAGADPNLEGWYNNCLTALSEAEKGGYTETVQLLERYGANKKCN